MSAETQNPAMTDGEDSIPLDEAGEVRLPIVEILTGRGFITGKSGSGKSNTASVVVEELLDRGFPVLVVDTDGEYWGLKEEYELLHVGADEECDLQVGPEHAGKLADLALEQNVPIILDVSGYLDQDDGDAVVRETARELFAKEKKLNKPFLMLVEEVHEYIPEGGGLDETGEMLIRIGKRGRKRGLGLCGISQRPADVKKDFITQCDWLMWHRLTWENDTQVVRRVVDSETADAVQDLADGEAFLMADFLDEDLRRVQVRRKHTFDAGATPDLAEVERPDLKSVSGDLVDELEEISEREDRRQNRIAELEAELEEKNERIAELEADLEDARDLQRLGEAFIDAAEDRGGSGDVDSQLLEEKNEEIADLRQQIDELETTVENVREERDDLEDEVERLRGIEERVEYAERVETQLEKARKALGVEVDQQAERGAQSDAEVEELRDELAEARERIDTLEAENQRLKESDSHAVEPLADYEEFLSTDAVKEEIEAAKEADSTSPRYVEGVIATIIHENGWVSYDTIAERLGVSTTTHVSKAASELERRKIIEKDRRDGGMHVDLNIDGLNEVREAAAQRQKTEELMEEL